MSFGNKKFIFSIFVLVFSFGFFWTSQALAISNWVSDPNNCNKLDAINFPGQRCAGVTKICGNDNGIARCYDPSAMVPPAIPAITDVSIPAFSGGGYLIDCYANLDSAAPFCDNEADYTCARNETCHNNNKLTQCTGFGASNCNGTACMAGFLDCNATQTDCEVQQNVTASSTGSNLHYAATCNTWACNADFSDCNGNQTGSDGACEIQNSTFCTANNSWAGCSAGTGSCSCDASYLNCDGNVHDCEINKFGTASTTHSNTTYGATCNATACSIGFSDCNGNSTGNDVNGCEIQNNSFCTADNSVFTGCSGGTGSCSCSAGYSDCDGLGANVGNGCEIQNSNFCGINASWNSCSAGSGSCSCNVNFLSCDGNSLDCEVNKFVTVSTTRPNALVGATCGTTVCAAGFTDCNGSGNGDDVDGCEVQNGASCGLNAVYAGCDAGASSCGCSAGYHDCNGNGTGSDGDGCEVRDGAICSSVGVVGSYSGCSAAVGRCVLSTSYFTTGIVSGFPTSSPLLWGQQLGNGPLMSFGNTSNSVMFEVSNDGSVYLATSTPPTITADRLYNVNDVLYWNGSAIGGTLSNWNTTTFGIAGLVPSSTSGTGLGSDGDGNLWVTTNNAVRMYFDTNGDVGINGSLSLVSTTPATTSMALYNVGGALYWNGSQIGSAGTSSLPVGLVGQTLRYDGSGGLEATSSLYITEGGYIGIGTTTPEKKLTVVGSISNLTQSSSGVAQIATTSAGANPSSIFVSGKYAYVADFGQAGNGGLSIIDITKPNRPVSVGSVVGLGVSNPLNVFVSGRYAYIGGMGSVISIIDVSNPHAPVQVSTANVGTTPNSIYVLGRYAYVTNAGSNNLSVVDVSNPLIPVTVTTVTAGTNPSGVFGSGRYVYVTNNASSSMMVFDINNPASPVMISTTTVLGGARAIYVSGRYAYIPNVNSSTISILDVSDPALPVVVSTAVVGTGPKWIYVAGRYAYVANNTSNNISIVDVGDPLSPIQVATTSVGAMPWGIFVSGKYAYTANYNSNSISVVDISGTEATSLLAHSADIGNLQVRNDILAQGMVMAGTNLTVGSGGILSNGALIVNASNALSYFGGGLQIPSNNPATTSMALYNIDGNLYWNGSLVGAVSSTIPTSSTSSLPDGSMVGQVLTWDGTSWGAALPFLSTSTVGDVHITGGELLIDQPKFALANSSVVSANGVAGIYSLAIAGKYAYIGTLNAHDANNMELLMVDISDPLSTPVTISYSNRNNAVRAVAVDGQYTYVGTKQDVGGNNFEIFDTSNYRAIQTPVGGVNVCPVSLTCYVNAIAISGKYAYIGTQFGGNTQTEGFQVYDISNPKLPVKVGAAQTGNGAVNAIAISGRYAYIGYSFGPSGAIFSSYDISNPANPVYLSSFHDGDTNHAVTSIALSGHYAYLGSRDLRTDSLGHANTDFVIIDVADPYQMTQPVASVDVVAAPNGISSIVVAGKYAYVGTKSAIVNNESLQVYDISSSTNPVRINGTITDGATVSTLAIAGNHLYVGMSGATGGKNFANYNIGGANIDAATIGNVSGNSLNVSESGFINALNVGTSLSVGVGGIKSNGALAITATNSPSTFNGGITLSNPNTQVTTALTLYNMGGTLYWNGMALATSSAGTTTFSGDLIPGVNNTYSLGSPTNQWKELYVSSSSIYIGGVKLSVDEAGFLNWNGVAIPTSTSSGTSSLPVGLDGQILAWSNGAWVGTSSILVASNGNVGIGTSSSFSTLNVGGDLSIDDLSLNNLGGSLYWGKSNLSGDAYDEALQTFGQSWEQRSVGDYLPKDVAVSANGQYQTAVGLFLDGFAGAQIRVSSDFGRTWSLKGDAQTYTGISMSADGRYQTAVVMDLYGDGEGLGFAYVSSDFGNTWNPKASAKDWKDVAVSANGKYQAIAEYDMVNGEGSVYLSSDFGQTWNESTSGLNMWSSVAISATGQYITAGTEGNIYYSQNFGSSWAVAPSAGSGSWYGLAMSANGKYQTAAKNGGRIYYSSNFGTTWVATGVSDLWTGIAMSADGKRQLAGDNQNSPRLQISTDYGVTWSAVGPLNQNWYSVAMSADGKYMVAADDISGDLYESRSSEKISGTSIAIGASSTAGIFEVFSGAGSALMVNNDGSIGIGTTATSSNILNVAGSILSTQNQAPILRGSTSTGAGSGPINLSVVGKFAYVIDSNSSKLAIFDISDETRMTALGTISTNLNTPRGLAVSGKYAYVINNNSVFSIFDVSDPSSIIAKGSTSSLINVPTDIYVSGKYAYISNQGSNKLVIFDVSDPNNPVPVGNIGTNLNTPLGVKVSGHFAYVINWGAGANSNSLALFDVSDPANIVAKGTISTNISTPVGTFVSGNRAYVISRGNNTMSIFDVSDSNNIAPLGSIVMEDEPTFVSVSGRYAYVSTGSNISVFDISNPANIVAKSTVYANIPVALNLSGKFLYSVSQSNNSLSAFEIGNIDVPNIATGLASIGGLQVIDDAFFTNNVSINGGLTVRESMVAQNGFAVVGGSSHFSGALSVSGTAVFGGDVLTGGLTIAPSVPVTTSMALYNQGGVLFWNGSPLLSTSTLAIGSLAGQTLYWNGTLWNSTSSIFVSSAGNVGIGTTAPTHKLQLSSGNFALPITSSSSPSGINGVIYSGASTYIHNYRGTYMGFRAGNLTNAAVENNIGIGNDVLSKVHFGYANVGIGSKALSQNVSGSGNIAIGHEALMENTVGIGNIAIGRHALHINTTGNENVVIGHGGLAMNESGSANLVIGVSSLMANIDGNNNLAFGNGVLNANVSGNDNVGIGNQSLALSTGDGNTAVGNSVLMNNAAGGNNTGLGSYSLNGNLDGSDNSAFGANALAYSNGSGNTAVGSLSMQVLNTGSYNTGIGAYSDVGSDVSNSVVIGAYSYTEISNALILGGTGEYALKVGIGTGSPQAFLHIHTPTPAEGENLFLLSSDAGNIFRFSASGTAYASDSWQAGGADYAEYFRTEDSDLQPGEAVCIDLVNNNSVKRCARGGDPNIIGVVSTNPSIVGNSKDGMRNNPDYVIVGMLGQVMTKASAENGAIRPGDSLTAASSTPGFVMKADAEDSTVGIALEKMDEGVGSIKVLISRRNKSMTVEQVEEKVTKHIAEMKIEDEVNLLVQNTVKSFDFSNVEQLNALIDVKNDLIKNGLEMQIDSLSSSTLGQVNVLTAMITEINGKIKDLENILNSSATTTASLLSGLTDRVTVVENNVTVASSSLADLQGVVSDLRAQISSSTISFGSLIQGNSLINNLFETLQVSSSSVFGGSITVQGPVKFGVDTVGQVKILSSAVSSTVKFVNPFEFLPIVTVAPIDYFGSWTLSKISTTSFDIEIQTSTTPILTDILFNWHAFESIPETVIYVSDGTTSTVNIKLQDETHITVEPQIEVLEAPISLFEETTTTISVETAPLVTITTTTPVEPVVQSTSTEFLETVPVPDVEIAPVPDVADLIEPIIEPTIEDSTESDSVAPIDESISSEEV